MGKSVGVVVRAILALVCLALALPLAVCVYPPLAGVDRAYTVLSGSMRPVLNPGDLILVKGVDPSLVEVGDIVTVKSEGGVFTHRVVEKRVENGVVLFRTKGDSNEDPDSAYLEASQIVGKVVMVIPFGILRTPYGFLLFVLLPALTLVGKHMYRIHQATLRRNRRQLIKWRRKMRNSQVLDVSSILLTLILLVGVTRVMAPRLQSRAVSYFHDEENVRVSISAGVWLVTADIDIDPDTLNLGSEGEWITVYIKVAGYDMQYVDVKTVKLNDTIEAAWGGVQDDGRLMVKFNRSDVIGYLTGLGYGDGDSVKFKVSGCFYDGTEFEGYDTITLREVRGREI